MFGYDEYELNQEGADLSDKRTPVVETKFPEGESPSGQCNDVVIRIHQKSSVLWYLKGFRKAFQQVFEIVDDLENIAIGGRGRWSFK